MTTQVKKAVTKTNPVHALVIETFPLNHDMKSVSFGIDDSSDLIIHFPVFVQPYNQLPVTLY